MDRHRSLGVLIAFTTTACVVHYPGERTVTRKPVAAEVKPRLDALPGKAVLAPDGTLQFTLALDTLCQRERASTEERGITKRKRFTALGIGLLATSIAAVGLSIYGFTQIETTDGGAISDGKGIGLMVGGVLGILTGGIGAPFILVYRYSDPHGYPETKGYQKLDERVVPEGSELVACPNSAAAVGTLALTTPWATTSNAVPSAAGVATFAIDWSPERARGLSATQLTTPWSITSETVKSATSWVPTADDAKRIAQHIASAQERVVVGATPPQLVATLDAGATAIEIGGSGQLVLTVKNTGASTGVAVVGKTRSSVAALHGQTFDFGNVQPGAQVTRSVAVSIPEDVFEVDATVLVTFTERDGHAPPTLTQKLPLARAICPGGKLTRAKYDQKRAKLKQARDAGDLKQEEFDRLDAELLRCLE